MKHLVKAAAARLGYHRHFWQFTEEKIVDTVTDPWTPDLPSGMYMRDGDRIIQRLRVLSAYCTHCGAPHTETQNRYRPITGKDTIPLATRVRWVVGHWGRN